MNCESLRVGKFEYMGKWPDDILDAVRPLLDTLEWLLPNWCQYATVNFNSDDGDNLASCGIDYGQRIVNIHICAGFFKCPNNDRLEVLLHELIHAFFKPLSDFARGTINKMTPDEEQAILRDVVINELNERNESCTQDLAHCLMKKLFSGA